MCHSRARSLNLQLSINVQLDSSNYINDDENYYFWILRRKVWQHSNKNHPPQSPSILTSISTHFEAQQFPITDTNTLTFTFFMDAVHDFQSALSLSSIYPHKSFIKFYIFFPVVCLSLRQQRRFFLSLFQIFIRFGCWKQQ